MLQLYISKLKACGDKLFQLMNFTGLEKYLNSILPVGQVTLKFCLPGALPHLPDFSNSLIIHESKMESNYRRVVSAHPYCTRKSTCHVMQQACAISTKMNNDRADSHCYRFDWI